MEANTDCLLADPRRQDYLQYGVRLYKAALIGDWGAAAQININYPRCFVESITKQGETALHIAAVSGHVDFVSQLVQAMAGDDGSSKHNLALANNIGSTALFFAASSGVVKIAKVMVEAHNELLSIRNKKGLIPLHMAALFGHRDMVNYLLKFRTSLSWEERSSLFISIINTDLYDIALRLVREHPDLAYVRDDQTRETPLHVLAKKSDQKSYEKTRSFWSRCFNRCEIEKASNAKLELVQYLWERVLEETQDNMSQLMVDPWRILFVAAEVGNVEFVITLIRCYPDLIWKLDEKNQSIFHVAVKFRQEKIFRLIFEIGAIKDLLATYTNTDTDDNILHLAALLPSSDRLNCISGAALQMQREMLWFTVVEDIVQPHLKEARNSSEQAKNTTQSIEENVTEASNNEERTGSTSNALPTREQNEEQGNDVKGKGRGKTPRALFTEQHKELRKEGEEWMRKTAGSCSVVATLIASVVFGAALKVPGSQGAWHWVFAISDSLSLIFSTASILIFLSIMTSRYAEKDFLKSLPQKLMLGLTMLFISIATMMVAFTATFHLMFNLGYLWVFTSVLSCIPIFLFGLQEFPLLLELSTETYWPFFWPFGLSERSNIGDAMEAKWLTSTKYSYHRSIASILTTILIVILFVMMRNECAMIGLSPTPLRILSSDDAERQQSSMSVRSREPAALKILAGCATPIRCLSSVATFKEHEDRVSIIVINDNIPFLIEQQLPMGHQHRSPSKVLMLGCRLVQENLRSHCHRWKRKISLKLQKKCAPGVHSTKGGVGSMNANPNTKTDADLESGTCMYIEAGPLEILHI